MNAAELSVFVASGHPKMRAPFSFGSFTYATNGHIAVRVPRMEEVPEWDALNEQVEKLFDSLDIAALAEALVDIPDFQRPEPAKCATCNGSGKASDCPECEGDGEVEFETKFNRYECDCLSCGGNGKVSGGDMVCGECSGTGNRIVDERIAVGCTGFSSHYLALLKDRLPGVKIAPTDPVGLNYFRWNGGDGILMPMRAQRVKGEDR